MLSNKEITIESTYQLLEHFLNLSKNLAKNQPAIVVF